MSRLVRGGAVRGGVPSVRHGRVELGGAVVDAEAAAAWTFCISGTCRAGYPQGREGAALSSGRALDNRGIWTFGAVLSTASRGDVEIATWLALGEHHGGGKSALATYHDAHASVRTLWMPRFESTRRPGARDGGGGDVRQSYPQFARAAISMRCVGPS